MSNPEFVSLMKAIKSGMMNTISLRVISFVLIVPFCVSFEQHGNIEVATFEVSSQDEVTISYSVYGEGDTVLLLVHGWSCDQTYWREQIDAFKEDYRVVTIDLGGHGKSTMGTREDWTMPSFAEDVKAVVNDLEYEKLLLVGHSMGSMVVLEAAAQMKNLPDAVICVDYLIRPLQVMSAERADAGLAPFHADFSETMKGFVLGMFHEQANENLKNWISEDMSSGEPNVAISAAKHLGTRDYSTTFETLKDSSVKKYIINSDKNKTDITHYENLGFAISVIEDSHHFMMMEQPKEFNQVLSRYLRH